MTVVQRLDRLRWKPARQRVPAFQAREMNGNSPLRDNQTGFIHHPADTPLEFKRIWFDRCRNTGDACRDFGLLFESDSPVPTGATLEISIALRSGAARFRGRVVLVRHNGRCFEIGLWFPQSRDASRLRIVEQICHIETYLKHKKYTEGPYSINREQVAAEWIDRYAETVPPL